MPWWRWLPEPSKAWPVINLFLPGWRSGKWSLKAPCCCNDSVSQLLARYSCFFPPKYLWPYKMLQWCFSMVHGSLPACGKVFAVMSDADMRYFTNILAFFTSPWYSSGCLTVKPRLGVHKVLDSNLKQPLAAGLGFWKWLLPETEERDCHRSHSDVVTNDSLFTAVCWTYSVVLFLSIFMTHDWLRLIFGLQAKILNWVESSV